MFLFQSVLRGSKRVEIAGLQDKRQITAVFAGSLIGNFLPIQLVYQEKLRDVILLLAFLRIGILHVHQLIGVMNKHRTICDTSCSCHI